MRRALPLALVVLFLSATWAAKAAEDKIVIDGSSTVGPIAKAFAACYMASNPDVNITVSESGSGNGVTSLINGTCDIASLSWFLTPKQFKAAVDKGVLPVPHTVAIDGVVIVVHPSNPVGCLTRQQVCDIYAGRINNWHDIGGPDLRIVRISRDSSSGTFEAFETLIMDHERIASDTEYVGTNGAMRQRIQSTPAAIGFVGLGFMDRTVRGVAIDGVLPSAESVASGRYPVLRPLFFFTNGYPRLGSHLHGFVTLHLTPRGIEIIRSLGYVPVGGYVTTPNAPPPSEMEPASPKDH